MDFLLGLCDRAADSSLSCACAGHCSGCLGACSGCSGCSGSK